MGLSSFAKINLSLKVNSKTNKGLHEIQSYFCLINLADKIVINKIGENKDKIHFKGPFAKLVRKRNNSVIELLNILRKLKIITDYYSINVTKNIPVFAGLGGGTSNAASVLKFLLKKKINKRLLNILEKKIGSDLRLFFHKQGFLKNLSSITNLPNKTKLYFVLIQPKVKCSTKEIYSKIKKYNKKEIFNKQKINSKKKYINHLSKSNNDLQSIVENKYPHIKKLLLDIIDEKGCYFSRMTGSGSVCYGLFKDEIIAKKALNKIKNKYPNFWVSFAKTV